MKSSVSFKLRREYYLSNILSFILIVGLIIILIWLSRDNGQFQFTSIYFIAAVAFMLIIPFGIITFFSSINSVNITENAVTIGYAFRSHKNVLKFDTVDHLEISAGNKAKVSDRLVIVMKDGRKFELSRSHFSTFDQLKSILMKKCRSHRQVS